MTNTNENINDKRNSTLKIQKKEEIQVTVSTDCESKLQLIMEKVNLDFDLSRVTRKHLLDHIIREFCEQFDDDQIHVIRKSAISDFDLLEIEYREAKKTGKVSDQLKDYLWKSHNLAQSAKNPKKNRQAKYSNAINTEEGES